MGLLDFLGAQNNFQATPVVNGFQSQQMGGVSGADPMLGNAQQNFAQQNQYIDMLRGQAMGTGPSVAQNLLRQQTDANNANAASAIASQRGMNPGLAAKLILDQQAGNQQQAAGQGATLRAQEMMGANSLLGNALGQQAQSNLGAGNLALGQQGQQLGNYWNAQGLNAGVAGQNAQLAQGAQSINAGVSAQNAGASAGLVGGLLNAAGGAAAMYAGKAHGGEIPGQARGLDSPKNDTVPAMLSPHEIVLPRSVTLADDAPERARDFVRAIKGRMPKKGVMYANGGEAGYPNPDAQENPMDPGPEASMPAGGPTPSTVAFFGGQTLGGPSPSQTPAATQGPGMLARPPEEAPQPTSTTPPPAPAAPSSRPTSDAREVQAGTQQQIGGITDEAQAAREFAKNQTDATDWLVQQQRVNSDRAQQMEKDYQARGEQIFNDTLTSDKINPNQLWEHTSTTGKIVSGIGMLLGGLGSGLTGQPNMAMHVIDKAIERDIEAQKLNLNKKQNALAQYMALGHTMRESQQFLAADLHDAAAAKLARAAQAYQGTKAAADAQVAIGTLRQTGVQLRQQATMGQLNVDNAVLQRDYMRRLMSGGGSAAKMGLEMSFLQHPEKRAEHTVGVDEEVPAGTDKNGRPLTQTKTTPYLANSPESRKEAATGMTQYRHMDRSLKVLEKFSKEHALGGTPGSEDVGEAEAAAMQLRMNYEAAMAGMNRQPSPEVFKHIDAIIADPTAFFKTNKTGGKIKFLRGMLNQHKQDILDANTLGPE